MLRDILALIGAVTVSSLVIAVTAVTLYVVRARRRSAAFTDEMQERS